MESFSIEKSAELGRYGVATRDLYSGEFLFDEFPFAIGPKPSTTCCCLECFIPIDATALGSRCENCSWPLCVDCSKKESEVVVHKRECEIFKVAKCKFFNLSDPTGLCVQLDCIMPLRVLLEKESNPKRWEKEVEPMEHHRDRRFGSSTWMADEQNVVGYLMGPCKLKLPGLDANLIQQVIGILEVNSFEGKTVAGHAMRCLYPKLAILSHSCTPNIIHSIHPTNGYKFEGRATMAIKKGDQLYSCYTFTLNGTLERQQHLQEGKFFQCHCERCLDPTELGTHFSTLKCQNCLSGNVISSDPLKSEAIWKCNKCSFKDASENVKRLTKALQDEIDSTSSSIDLLESLLEKHKSALHSNHFIMICIKNALIDLYGHVKGHLLLELPDVLLRRKIELCEEVLAILDVFESGKSRARGLMLYELHAPMVMLAKSRFEKGTLTKLEYLRQLESARNLLNECLEILTWEDENVFKPIKLAKVSLENLDNYVANVKKKNLDS